MSIGEWNRTLLRAWNSVNKIFRRQFYCTTLDHRRSKKFVDASTTGRGLLTDRRVQTQASAHALLPIAAFALAFFDLSERGGQGFTTQLPHLDVQQRRNDRH